MTSVAQGFTGGPPRYNFEAFGIEVEAERLVTSEWTRVREGIPPAHPLLQGVLPVWRLITDGSLRHNGVEFVTTGALRYENAQAAVNMLAPVFAERLVRTSLRAGIHVHYNLVHRSAVEVLQFLQTYIIVEPLLFQLVGKEREQNIYCVPLYAADNEMEVWRHVVRSLFTRHPDPLHPRRVVHNACKYSALFIGPLRTFGSVEFRHAPTWESPEPLLRWLRVIKRLGEVAVIPNADNCAEAVPDLFREALEGFDVDWDQYFKEVDERGLVDRARSLLPCTYKVKNWGAPAGMVFGATEPSAMLGIHSGLFSTTGRIRTPEVEAEDDLEYDEGNYDEEEDE